MHGIIIVTHNMHSHINYYMQWSFGVTCWEVFSLGRTPYPAIDNSDIFNYISSGKRLLKPSLCPDEG